MKLGQGIAPGAPIAPSLADTCEERAPFLISQQGIHDTSTYNLRGRQTALTNINAGLICSRRIYRILMPNGCLGREPIPLRRRLESPGQVPGLFHLGPSKRVSFTCAGGIWKMSVPPAGSSTSGRSRKRANAWQS